MVAGHNGGHPCGRSGEGTTTGAAFANAVEGGATVTEAPAGSNRTTPNPTVPFGVALANTGTVTSAAVAPAGKLTRPFDSV